MNYLLFADNSLLFCRAFDTECRWVLGVLKLYEWASEQKINIQKSKTCFSRYFKGQVQGRLECVMCNSQGESTIHLMAECPYARCAWMSSTVGVPMRNRYHSSFLSWLDEMRSYGKGSVILLMFVDWEQFNGGSSSTKVALQPHVVQEFIPRIVGSLHLSECYYWFSCRRM